MQVFRGCFTCQIMTGSLKQPYNFAQKKNCVTNIKNSKISIPNLHATNIIAAVTLIVSQIDRQNIMDEGFIIA